MNSETGTKFNVVGYFLGLLIAIGAFVVGNVGGRIVASLQGWHDFSYDKPGGVFYAAIQGGFGAYLALLASRSWLDDGKYARFWLGAFVWLMSGMICIAILMSLYTGDSNIVSWDALAGVISVVAIEVVRRFNDNEVG